MAERAALFNSKLPRLADVPFFRQHSRDEQKIGAARSREMCPGGVGFETRSASGGCGAVLVANSTRAGLHGGEYSRDWQLAWPSI